MISDIHREVVPPGGIKTEGHFFFIRLHTVDGKLTPVDGAGDGDGLGHEGGDTFYKGRDPEEEDRRFDELDTEGRLIVFRFPESFYPALYEMSKIF